MRNLIRSRDRGLLRRDGPLVFGKARKEVTMRYVVDSREMKHYEELVMDTMGIPSLMLMERAAMALAEEVRACAVSENLREKKLLVVAGSGNNGADGMAVARILSMEGWQVTVYQTGSAGHCTREWERQNKFISYYPV